MMRCHALVPAALFFLRANDEKLQLSIHTDDDKVPSGKCYYCDHPPPPHTHIDACHTILTSHDYDAVASYYWPHSTDLQTGGWLTSACSRKGGELDVPTSSNRTETSSPGFLLAVNELWCMRQTEMFTHASFMLFFSPLPHAFELPVDTAENPGT